MCTILLAGGSTLIPIFIGVFDHWILAKLIPSILAASSALTMAFVELEKPQERWNLYRRTQRILEAEKASYQYALGDYANSDNADKQLMLRLQKIQLDLHDEWSGLIPRSGDLVAYGGGPAAIRKIEQ